MDVHRKVAYSRRCRGRPVRSNLALHVLHAKTHAIDCHASLHPLQQLTVALTCSSRTAVAPLERLKILMQIQGSKGIYTGVWQVMQHAATPYVCLDTRVAFLCPAAVKYKWLASQHMPCRDASTCTRRRACGACFKGMAPTVSESSPIKLSSSWHTSRSHGEPLQLSRLCHAGCHITC